VSQIAEITGFLNQFAPVSLAEDWDNVGLLIGNDANQASAVITCLTLTPDVASEAIRGKAQLIVSHHPILFRAVQRMTTQTWEGRMLIALIEARISVYCPHTGYDSARDGINQQLAELFDLSDITALRPQPAGDGVDQIELKELGAGRRGSLPSATTLEDFNQQVKRRLGIDSVQYVGEPAARIERVGIACGSAAEFLPDAHEQDCQVLLTGEARFHACLEAETLGIALVLAGHYASERPAMERLAEILAGEFPNLTVWASESESDPLKWG